MCVWPAGGSIVSVMEACEPVKPAQCEVFVPSLRRRGRARVLISMGATVATKYDHGLSVTGLDTTKIASGAAAHYIPIQELTPRSTPPQDTNTATADQSRDRAGRRRLTPLTAPPGYARSKPSGTNNRKCEL